jgi:hypothetical protein
LSFSNLHHLTFLFQIFSGFVPLGVLLFHRKKFNLEIIVLLSASVLATILLLVVCMFYDNNHAVFNSYALCEFVCLTIYFLREIDHKYFRKLILGMAIILGAVFTWEMNRTSSLKISLVSEVAYTIILCVLYFIANLDEGAKKSPMYKTQINYTLAIFLYSSFSIIFFFFIDEMMKSGAWFMHNIFESLSKLFIAYAFWKLPKTTHF